MIHLLVQSLFLYSVLQFDTSLISSNLDYLFPHLLCKLITLIFFKNEVTTSKISKNATNTCALTPSICVYIPVYTVFPALYFFISKMKSFHFNIHPHDPSINLGSQFLELHYSKDILTLPSFNFCL